MSRGGVTPAIRKKVSKGQDKCLRAEQAAEIICKQWETICTKQQELMQEEMTNHPYRLQHLPAAQIVLPFWVPHCWAATEAIAVPRRNKMVVEILTIMSVGINKKRCGVCLTDADVEDDDDDDEY